MPGNGPARLLILGSCVSRDILNFLPDKTQLVLVDYYARCSLASLGARPIDMPPAVQTIRSPFQQRMIERDIRKAFLHDLDGLQFDLLLIDFIDERFSLHVQANGRICTLSSELVSSGFRGDSNGGSVVVSGSDEFLNLWESGWATLCGKLRRLGVLDRLRINQVFWSSRTKSGENYEPNFSANQIDSANNFLGRIYDRVRVDIPSGQFLRFDQELMTGSVAHKWGISPFHFDDSYYHAAIQQLTLSVPYVSAEKTSRAQLPGDTTLALNEGAMENNKCKGHRR